MGVRDMGGGGRGGSELGVVGSEVGVVGVRGYGVFGS